MRKNKVYEIDGITPLMAIVDSIPVLFFIGSSIIIGLLFGSFIFLIGAALTSLAGICKVLWKYIMATKHKNQYQLNLYFKRFMPVGFLLMLLSLVIDYKKIVWKSVFSSLIGFPQLIFFLIGMIGMSLMMTYKKLFDISKAKSNWIAQITNAISQACFFIGLLCILI